MVKLTKSGNPTYWQGRGTTQALKNNNHFEGTLAKLSKIEDAYIPWHNNFTSRNIILEKFLYRYPRIYEHSNFFYNCKTRRHSKVYLRRITTLLHVYNGIQCGSSKIIFCVWMLQTIWNKPICRRVHTVWYHLYEF